MTNREKWLTEKTLVALLGDMDCEDIGLGDCSICEYREAPSCRTYAFADCLMAHGVVARERGEWEPILDSRGEHKEVELYARWWRCKKCGHEDFLANFCPECGADMRSVEK